MSKKKQRFKEFVADEVNVQYITSLVSKGSSITQAVRSLCELQGVEYEDSLRRLFSIKLEKQGVTDNVKRDKTAPVNNKREVGLSVPTVTLSALKPDGTLMTVDEYCSVYRLERKDVKSYKLVTHTGVPYYNIQSFTRVSNSEGDGIVEIMESLEDKLGKHVPKYDRIPERNKVTNNLLVIDVADAHFGKLSSSYETGEAYSLNVARQRVIEGVKGIVDKGRNFGIDKVLFVVGNDVLHYDTPKRTTTSGTPQDSDVMFFDMFNVALDTHVQIVEMLIQEFEVDIMFCPSNHDYQSGWFFARTLATWFRNCDRVTVDDSIAHRKYYQYGANMIGLSHGDGAKMVDMPLLMANESPKLWADTKFRYIFLHHIHHKQVTKFQSGKDYIGATVEYLRSPSSADSWHYRNGYVGSKKAIEGFIHNFNDGQVARLTHYFE